MPSLEQDSAQPADAAGRLCPACGLCCNGVLFADVRLVRPDNPLTLEEAGLTLVRRRGRSAFAQPCACFDGRLCAIYPNRPSRCRGFNCHTLKQVQSRQLTYAQARRRIQATVKLAYIVRQLLRALGQTDESLPLTHRYRQVMEQPIDLSDGDTAADLRGHLMLAVNDLMHAVHGDFLREP